MKWVNLRLIGEVGVISRSIDDTVVIAHGKHV
jgi:hypothetical protein